MQSENEYQKKLEKVQQYQKKQRETYLAKLADPNYREQQYLKQRQAQERAVERRQKKLACPEYRAAQFEKQKATQSLRKTKNLTQSRNAKPKRIRSRGLYGRAPNAAELVIQNKIAALGCLPCINHGFTFDDPTDHFHYVSLHHVDGRVSPFSQVRVLGLCAAHHQVVFPKEMNAPKEIFPIHGFNKKLWQELNGTEEELLIQTYELIGEPMPWLVTDVVSI